LNTFFISNHKKRLKIRAKSKNSSEILGKNTKTATPVCKLMHHNIFISRKKELKKPNKIRTRSDTLAMSETTETNAVLIGKKPVMNYVLACITLFHGGAKHVNVKARGKSISRAIDVAEVVRRRFLPDVKVKKISIGTDKLTSQDESDDPTNVSTIEITLER
jgi:archaea-specific DNA-binding protein